jgi:hypothetical protein
MELYPGTIITPFGCTAKNNCTSQPLPSFKGGLDACIEACVDATYATCRAVQYTPANSFGQVSPQCTLYDARVEDMGAHATAEVLTPDGGGAVLASYCAPPKVCLHVKPPHPSPLIFHAFSR